MNINWKWPSKPNNTLRPWYGVVWEVVWFPVYVLGVVLLVVAVVVTDGRRRVHRLLDKLGEV